MNVTLMNVDSCMPKIELCETGVCECEDLNVV